MKAISLQPPWGWLMLHGPKDFENRRWRSNFTGRIVIHQSMTWDKGAMPTIHKIDPHWWDEIRANLPAAEAYGLIGEVTFGKQVTKANSPWFFGPYAWPASDPLPYARTLNWTGQLGIFDVPDQLIGELRKGE